MRGENLAPPVRPLAHQQRGRVLADDQIEIGVIGHAVAFVGRTPHLRDAALGVPTPPDVGRHVGEQKEMLDGVPDRPLGEGEARAELADRRVGVDQGLEFRLENGMGHRRSSFMELRAPLWARARPRRFGWRELSRTWRYAPDAVGDRVYNPAHAGNHWRRG